MIYLMVALLLWATELQADEDDLVLIANPSVETHQLNRDTARAMFAMRQRTWPDGQAARIFVLPNDDHSHERFVKQFLNVYPHQLQMAWDRVVFSGTGQAPSQVDTEAEMLEQVASTPGGMGYLEKKYLDDRVNVIPLD
ncbi:hypothetical protein [Pistricoccus aurantiacus]|uniref:hypothetical protein n=1 Tax=Pistricoccus aurantiacus TaxID=1883414 RepID=UPI003625BDC3